jgi:hypothetical protein
MKAKSALEARLQDEDRISARTSSIAWWQSWLAMFRLREHRALIR